MPRRLLVICAIAVVAALALAASAGAARLPGSSGGGRPLVAPNMVGANEVPPGDPDGSGSAILTFNPGIGEVCWSTTVENITLPAIASHIHEGEAGEAGGIVVTLSPPDESGTASGCTTADRSLIKAIMKNPAGYYVNVHTTDYPGGAVRDQLSK